MKLNISSSKYLELDKDCFRIFDFKIFIYKSVVLLQRYSRRARKYLDSSDPKTTRNFTIKINWFENIGLFFDSQILKVYSPVKVFGVTEL